MTDTRKSIGVVLMGATGAVGSAVLDTLDHMPEVSRVTVLARRPVEAAVSAKVAQHIVDVLDATSYQALLGGHDAAICTLGVGQPSKVSREEFHRIDRDAVLAFARACRGADVSHFELLGSVAADAASRNFYLQSKGELRDAIAAMGFRRFSVFQPSMLLTKTNRYGLSQGLLLAIWPLLSPLLPGRLRKYRGIAVEALGKAMAVNVLTTGQGTEILHWPEFSELR